MLSTVMLLGLTAAAAATDLLRNKIYNWNTYGGILAALAVSAAGQWLRFGGSELRFWPWLYWPHPPNFWESLGGLMWCGGLMIVCFAVFPGIGGGDVKLMAMIGALLGTHPGLEALLWTFLLGAVMAVAVLIWRIGPITAVSRVVRLMTSKLRLPWFAALNDDERKVLKPPIFLAPSALAAVVIVRFHLIT
jgi:prepilin peptidase CpaA